MRNYNSPTLPVGLTALFDHDNDTTSESRRLIESSRTPLYSGPAPPKSWMPIPEKDVHETSAWRTKALSIVASHLDNFLESPGVPSLAFLCMQLILSECKNSKELQEDVIPFIPPHLRRQVIRHCAVHSPLPGWKLYALFNVHGHADGEIIVIGPDANLRENHFIREPQDDNALSASRQDWEIEDGSDNPLRSIILVSTRLPTSTLLLFPPTLTLLALINLPNSIPLYRLPKLCPLLSVLDLSYNFWLNEAVGGTTYALDKIEWSRWSRLRVLGLRGCFASIELLEQINRGRWDDVNIIQ